MRSHAGWSALLDPGRATSYFGTWGSSPFRPDPGFRAHDALWMAELSRLAYRKHPTEAGASDPAPRTILASVGLRETLFLDRRGTQCLGVESAAASSPCAVLAFRGTSEPRDLLIDVAYRPMAWDVGRVHGGFIDALQPVWPDLQPWLSALRVPLLLTGHSLGAALATLVAVRSKVAPCAVYTFGSPRAGDLDFARAAEARAPIHRVVNDLDVVATSPGFQPFVHAGAPVRIDLNGGVHAADPSESLAGAPAATHLRFGLAARLAGASAFRFLTVQGPPPELADHAPANYVAGLEVAARQPAFTP